MKIESVRQVNAKPDWYEPYAISLGIQVGNLIFVSGQAAVDEQARTVGGDDFDAQARQGLRELGHRARQLRQRSSTSSRSPSS